MVETSEISLGSPAGATAGFRFCRDWKIRFRIDRTPDRGIGEGSFSSPSGHRADGLGISNSGNSSNQDHCLANVIDSSKFFAMWTQRIASIPDWFIESICREVQGQGVNKSEVDEAIDFLNHRKQNLGQLVLSKKKRFQEITDFPVIL